MAATASSSFGLQLRSLALKQSNTHQSTPFSFSYTSRFNATNSISPKTVAALSSSTSPIDNSGFGFSVERKSGERAALLKTEAVREVTGSVISAQGLRFAIVIARFNEIVTRPLLNGALDTFHKYSVKEEDIDVVWVPGAFEIALAAEKLGKTKKYQAIICIGAIVRGDTTHYDAVANSAASGVLSAGLNSGVPCIFGVLTCDNMDQALNRAGGKAGNKGSEAALTAIEMASLFEHHFTQL